MHTTPTSSCFGKRPARAARFGLALAALSIAGSVFAGPSLLITRPSPRTDSVKSGPPSRDLYSSNGMWVHARYSVNANFCRYEFHDDSSSTAIVGRIKKGSIKTRTSSEGGLLRRFITGFSIEVTVRNDGNASMGASAATNAQGESRKATSGAPVRTMDSVFIVAEFASSDTVYDDEGKYLGIVTSLLPSNIIAVNNDAMAYYNGSGVQTYGLQGSYIVPAWSLGNIAPNKTSTVKTLDFIVRGSGIPSKNRDGTPNGRYDFFTNAEVTGRDIFSNPSGAFKINKFPAAISEGGSVSVFHR
jgi:hypothetical protein